MPAETLIEAQDAGTLAGTATRATVSTIEGQPVDVMRELKMRLEVITKPEGTNPTFDLYLQRLTQPDPGDDDWQDFYHYRQVTDDAALDLEVVLTPDLLLGGLLDPLLAIAHGMIPGLSHVNKFGNNPDIDQIGSATAVKIGRDIWDGGIVGATMWLPPTAARTHQIASSDAEDGAGTSTGALTIRIFGLDANYALQQEDLTLNGQANVPTANTYTMIHRMQVLTAGSLLYNKGDIEATADDDSTVTAMITAEHNQTQMAIYQIPAATTGYITHWGSELHKAGGQATFADLFLMSKEFGGVWRVRDSEALAAEGTGTSDRQFIPYEKLEAKEYVKVVGNPSKDGQDIGAEFDIILVDDDAFGDRAVTQESLAAGIGQRGHWGEQIRVREVVGGSALSQGCVYSLHAVGH